MRSIVLSVCVLTAACSGQALNSPTPPESADSGPAQKSVASGQLPFRGSFTLATSGTLDCPPTCPPTTLRVAGTGEGTAIQLGRFSMQSLDVVDLATARSTGTLDFTAANGDRLFTTTVGREDQFVPPNISHVSFVATIVGGTGRFVGASGSFTARHVGAIDFAAGTSSASGSFEGHITLSN
jgi:hypothetical protein